LVMTCLVSIWPYHITPLSLVILVDDLHRPAEQPYML